MRIKGMAIYDQGSDGYGNSLIQAQLERLVTLGVNLVSLTVNFDMATFNSNSVFYAGYDADVAYIQAFIRKAHSLGLKVMFKQHTNCNDGRWGGRIYPTDWNAWFASYTALLVQYASLCEAEGVEFLCVGNELTSSTGSDENAPYPHEPNFNRSNWTETIRQVRNVYHGALTYAAHVWTILDDSFPFDLLDYIGCNPYFPVSTSLTDTVEQIVQNWTTMSSSIGRSAIYSNWKGMLEALKTKYGKPLIFTETCYYQLFSGGLTPFPNQQDQQWQANCFEAFFRVWNAEAENIVWEWCDPTRPIVTKSPWVYHMGPQDKLAEQVIKTWYAPVPHTLVITSSPIIGVPVTVDGVQYTTPTQPLTLLEGTHTVIVPSNFMPVDPMMYNFKYWEDGSTNPTRSIDLTADLTISCTYELKPPPPPAKGYLELHAFLDSQELVVQYEIVGVASGNTPATVQVNVGIYTVNITYQGKTTTQTASVGDGQTIRLDFQILVTPIQAGTSSWVLGIVLLLSVVGVGTAYALKGGKK